jgi:hypothetical protein
LEKWTFHDNLPFNYEHYERVLWQRNSIFDTGNIKTGRRTWIPEAVQNNLLFIAKQSVNFGFSNNAIKAIAKMKNLENLTNETKLKGLLEEAKLNMVTNTELAKSCLKQILEDKQIESDYILKCHAFRLFGEILAENYSMEFSNIVKNYFNKSMAYLERYANNCGRQHLVATLEINPEQPQQSQYVLPSQLMVEDKGGDDIDAKIQDASSIYDTMAKYYDRLYEEKINYLKSPVFLEKKKSLEKNQSRIETMKKEKEPSIDFRKSLLILKKHTEQDRREVVEAEKEKKIAARNCV